MKKFLLIFFIPFLFLQVFASTTESNTSQNFELQISLSDDSPFKLSPLKDSLLITGGTLLWGTDLYLDKILKYNDIDVDNFNFDRSRIPNLDQLLMFDYSKPLDITADISAGCTLLTPLALVFTDSKEWLKLSTLYAESLLYAQAIKDFGKIMVNRARPYMYYPDYPQKDVDNGDWNDSFPSGHTTLAFTAATFVSYTYCSYFPDSDFRIAVIATSYTLATTTGILRILSGNHFYSDVITGAIIGTVTGFTIPFLHRNLGNTLPSNNQSNNRVSFIITPNQIDFSIYL